MKPLTSTEQWDAHWEQLTLPNRVDLRSYYSYRCHQLFQSIVPRGGQRRFIDVGCGLGQWLIYFHETFGYEVVGIDNSRMACDLARRNLEIAGVPGEIIYGDAITASLEPRSFDVVFSGGLIEHFDDPLPLIQRMSRLVKSGGLQITVVPNLNSFFCRVREWLDAPSFEGHREVTPEMLYSWLEQSMMDDISVRYFGSIRLPYVRRRGSSGVGVQVPAPAWVTMRSLDKGITSLLKWLSFSPEARWLSPEIIAIARNLRHNDPHATANGPSALPRDHSTNDADLALLEPPTVASERKDHRS